MIYGYARVSTREQNLDMQLEALNKYHVDIIIQDKISTRKENRLDDLLSQLQAGDILVIWKLDRLGRNLRELLELTEIFDNNDIGLVSLNDLIDTKSPMGKCFFAITGAFAQLERDMISMRTFAGLDSARAIGHLGGRPPKDPKEIATALKFYRLGLSSKEIHKTTGVSSHTLYVYLRKEVSRLFALGKTIEEIVDETHYNRDSVLNWLEMQGFFF